MSRRAAAIANLVSLSAPARLDPPPAEIGWRRVRLGWSLDVDLGQPGLGGLIEQPALVRLETGAAVLSRRHHQRTGSNRPLFDATIWQRSIGDFQDDWEDAVFFLSESVTYDFVDLEPQLGLVPMGPDPKSGLWRFWHVESGSRPIRDEASGKLTVTGESGMVLVLLPGGTFSMGAQADDPNAPHYYRNAQANEGPVHEVTLAPFFLSKFEMTQGQWLQIMGENPSYWSRTTSSGSERTHCCIPWNW